MGVLFRPGANPQRPPSTDEGWGAAVSARLKARWQRDQAWLASLERPLVLYGATSQGQAFLNAFPDQEFVAVADDNPDYAGYALYTLKGFTPVVPATDERLHGCAHIIITAYLHDAVIAERFCQAEAAGRIWSIRASEPMLSGEQRR